MGLVAAFDLSLLEPFRTWAALWEVVDVAPTTVIFRAASRLLGRVGFPRLRNRTSWLRMRYRLLPRIRP